MSLTLADALGPVADAFLIQLYFSTADDERSITKKQKGASFAFLLTLVLLAARGVGLHTFLRLGIRVVCYVLYLYFAKGIWNRRGFFLATFAASCAFVSQNIFMSPLMKTVVDLLGLPGNSAWLNLLFTTVVRVLIIFVLYHYLPLRHIEEPSLSGWLPLAMTVLCIMLTKELQWSDQEFSESASLVFILLQVFMLLFLLVFERERFQAKLEKESRIQNAVNEERLKVYKYQYKADEEVRRLRHDMKNHLVAVRSLMGEQKNDAVQKYLDDLLEQAGEERLGIETGNSTLDGLLSQKTSVLRESGIRFDMILDFRGIDFISNMDLCTIFGNAVDNAIEACRKMDNRGKRYISIHSEIIAGQLIISFVNSYQGEIRLKNGLPITSKKDPHCHGIGLSSIRKAVRKYGGVAEVDLSVPEQFSLIVLLPLPATV